MTATPLPPLQSADAAMLLVLLPPVGTAPQVRVATLAALAALQRELGAAIRVLTVDEASHPSVVHSFHTTDLPCFVLVRQGVELLRESGLPEGEAIVPLLLRKLGSAQVVAE
ncbi:thioredoxin [Hymenobacter elongatus]|uniref:Thioredoxin n=1 Tax=Hymenobacter elongatus TaxID=877208 RepID=A0A4Z0PM09_9BACT|nr:thioredoxin [Hymenobacter elongatus]TGE16563.1 thioredoxin [Hymenobacter elongatus]